MANESQHISTNGRVATESPARGANHRIGIHGASPAIARSLAHRFASSGAQVALVDGELRRAEKAFHDVASRLRNGSNGAGDLSQRIQIDSDLTTLNQQSLVFHVPSRQAQPDDIARDIRLIESVLSAETPILTMVHDSTSAAAITPQVESNARLMALHVPLPRFPVPFGQVIHGQAPSRAALESAREILGSIGITPVETTHALGGLLLDRQFISALGEACQMLRSGEATIAALDQGFPIPWLMHLGPLQAADLLGIDHVIATARSLSALTGNDRFSPDPLLEALEERGHLGWKNGRGFYNYALDD